MNKPPGGINENQDIAQTGDAYNGPLRANLGEEFLFIKNSTIVGRVRDCCVTCAWNHHAKRFPGAYMACWCGPVEEGQKCITQSNREKGFFAPDDLVEHYQQLGRNN